MISSFILKICAGGTNLICAKRSAGMKINMNRTNNINQNKVTLSS